jgi:hypothetical protein
MLSGSRRRIKSDGVGSQFEIQFVGSPTGVFTLA